MVSSRREPQWMGEDRKDGWCKEIVSSRNAPIDGEYRKRKRRYSEEIVSSRNAREEWGREQM